MLPNRLWPVQAAALGALLLCANASAAPAPDRYAAAVAQPGRTPADLARDAIDHPAEVLRLAGIRPGMQVADILAADGYYSELASRIVGPTGHVLLLNNGAFEKWSEGAWKPRLENGRLPNVEHQVVELEKMQLGHETLDAVLLVKVYHDLYWVDPEGAWPAVDVHRVLDDIAAAVKPGGTLLLVDHAAKAGTGAADAGRLHRIDEAYARKDFESRGFHLVAHSDALRHADDPREQVSYKSPMLGKTDKFVLVFRKKK
jgi:predicted methyltransferase